ncbi:MAG: dTDP-L-rhamnose 4-epimerase [Candidatus Lokiarchaeum sp. GC14_75]|nr:MAG: dTDP-L-rhamnose 4-epimerase [Candidatus Lokiarchaeum sp. GC14_75]
MSKKILITGGAGFIGSHLTDKLIKENDHDITIYDTLSNQVHGQLNKLPDYLNKQVRFVKGSVTEYGAFEELLKENEIVIHLAARVGVGQSMYQISKYADNNILGLANLLDILVNSNHDVEKVVISSSNTVYGEGKAFCDKCGIIFPELRFKEQLKRKDWEIICPTCDSKAIPLSTDEKTPYNSTSIYALSKQVQEEMSLMISKTFGLKTTILRFFLVYGPRQALSNPYTGVCSNFCTRLLNGKPPEVFEDGLQSRDFVNVMDVCQAMSLVIKSKNVNGEIFNVGTGIPISIREVANIITEKINPKLKPIFNQQYRVGDIRHCFADITKIKNKLGYEPEISFSQGIEDYLNWVKTQKKFAHDKTDKALIELNEKGLLR